MSDSFRMNRAEGGPAQRARSGIGSASVGRTTGAAGGWFRWVALLTLLLAPSVVLASDGSVVYSNNSTTPQYRAYAASANTFGAETATAAGAAQTWVVNRAAATRDEHIAGYVTTGGVLYILRWNGSTATWSNEWNVNVGGDGVNGRRFDITYETTSGNAMVVYSTNATGSSGNAEMAYRIWNGSSWTAAANVVANSTGFNQAAAVTWIKLRSRPTSGSNEIALLAADTGTTTANTSILTSFIWNGSAWTEAGTTHTGSAGATLPNTTGQLMQNECFDQAYESLSGDLLVVFSVGSANQQWYRTYSGGTWGSATSYATGRAVPLQMLAESDPRSDQVLVMWNRSGNTGVYANVWTGTAVGTTTNIANGNGLNPTAVNKKHIAATWLVTGGVSYAVPMWVTGTPGTIGYAYYTGGAWTAGAAGFTYVTGTGTTPNFMDLAADPFSPDTAMLTFSTGAAGTGSLWAKRLVLTAGPTFTFTNADGGTAESTTLASVTTQNFDFAWERLSASTDLAITMTGSWGVICQGNTVTYAMNVTNNGPDTATAVTVTDPLPVGLTYVSATPSQGGPCTNTAGTVTCPIGSLAAGGTATITLVATGTTTGAKSNTATVAGSAVRELVPGNNSAIVITTVSAACADVSLTKTLPAGGVNAGQNASFTLTARNNSATTSATGVTVTDPLPAELTFVSATPSQGGPCTAGPPVNCPLGTLAPGATATVTLVATGNTVGRPLNTAVATMSEGDSNPANNTGWVWVGIQPLVADLQLVKTASVGSVGVGGNVTYTLTVTNLGPAAAGAVSVTDPIPPGMSFVSAAPSQGSCSGNLLVTCSLGSIPFPGSATVTLIATNTTTGTKSNTATVLDTAFNDFDPNMSNNNSTVTTTVTGGVTPLCASPGQQGAGGTLTGIVNTYWPGTASVTAGVANTCIPVGASAGATTTLAADNLLLVVQMQDADINSSNTTAYGDGTGIGAGATAVGAGKYEFVTARGAIGSSGCAANQIPITGTGANGGLLNSYSNTAATSAKGQMRYQVVFVPQYTTATLAGATASPWTTSNTGTADCTPADTLGCGTGGILAIDVQGALTLASGLSAIVDGLGFRGGAGRQLGGDAVAPAALDTWTNISSTSPGNASGTVTPAAFTVTAGTNRILLVAATAELSTASTLATFSVRYGGVVMRPISTTAASSSLTHAGMWYLRNAEVPAGSNSVILSYATASGNVTGLHIKRASYSGVDQVNPINSSAANVNAAANVTLGAAVNYLPTNINVYVAANGGTPATIPTQPADFVAIAAGTVTTNGFTSFVGQSPAEAAAGNYAAGTTLTFGPTTAPSSAVVAASIGFGLTNTDWRTSSTRATNGSKGEGIAGTPEWIQATTGPVQTNQPNDGYPGGSYARGAPANAGGGSTDDNPTGTPGNDRNSGGGGGSNGGAGGTGGHSWSTCLDRGGRGAAVTPAITKLVLGGGGGAGTRNNSDGDALAAGGAAGGGLMVLRASQLIVNTGAILSANGADAYDGTANDGSGGGGAGGSVVLTVTSGTMSGLAIRAHGGAGGSNWLTVGNGGAGCDGVNANHHGPGGGGGGGVIVYTNTAVPPTLDVSGGQPGVTTADANTFSAQPGGTGQLLYPGPGSIPGFGSGPECTSDPAITLTHSGTTLTPGGTATITASVRNAAPYTATSGLITAVINLGSGPPSLTATAVSAPGWNCSGIPGTVVTCTRSDSLAAQLGFEAIVITASVGSASQPGTITNTATLTNGADINLANNLATDPIGVAAPTLARIRSFKATRNGDVVELRWRSSFEIDNLGFVVHREVAGERRAITPSVIAGSALSVGPARPLQSGRAYAWIDDGPGAAGDVRYWLEDIALDGTRRWTGPVVPESSTSLPPDRSITGLSPTLDALGRVAARDGAGVVPAGLGTARTVEPPSLVQALSGAGTYTASRLAAKILVAGEGWYRVTKSDLVAAGFDPGTDPAALQLFAERTEQPMIVRDGGDGRFDASDAIEFYGLGLDSPWTGERVYWLLAGAYNGQRVVEQAAGGSLPPGPTSFPFTVERKDHVVYFGALTADGTTDNFFGPPVTATPLDQTLTVAHLDTSVAGSLPVTVTLQGVTDEAHVVDVRVNGHDAGTLTFSGQAVGTGTYTVPLTWIAEGTNTVTLTARGSATDTSVVASIRLVYPHFYLLDQGALRLMARSGTRVTLGGLTDTTLRVVDVTKPAAVRELPVTFTAVPGGYTGFVQVSGGDATLYAFTPTRVSAPAGIVRNVPSNLSNKKTRADLVIIAHPSLLAAVAPLQAHRRLQGLATVLADVTDVYDEFGFGEKSPDAIRAFLNVAREKWDRAPGYVLLVGDASFDPKDYLGFGDFDLVPTRMVSTAYMLTDSDDGLVDFDGDGLPDMAIGRLPVRTAAEAATVVSKIVSHDQPGAAGAWSSKVLLVSDAKDEFDFTAASGQLVPLMPAGLTTQPVSVDALGSAGARSAIVSAVNAGQLLVNYMGHGSEDVWSQSDIFNGSDAAALTNGTKLPTFVLMTCLNGLFDDLWVESLAESLLKAPAGGAVAVWASSTLTAPEPQAVLNQALFQLLQSPSMRLGDAVKNAKAAVTDPDVRRSWILFGDPTMRLRPAP